MDNKGRWRYVRRRIANKRRTTRDELRKKMIRSLGLLLAAIVCEQQ